MIHLGKVRPGSTIRIPFGTYAALSGATTGITGYVAGDIQIYKNGSTTQRSSTSGITATENFDGIVGIHTLSIDTADNTVAGFWSAGAEYLVIVADVTIDTQNVRFPVASFILGVDGAQVESTINIVTSQTVFSLLSGPAENGALVGCPVYLHDVSSAAQCAYGYVTSYVGSTRTITLAEAPTFTISADDNVSIFPRIGLHSLAGVALTGRDIGASVLLSPGTGTGQVQVSSGVVQGDVRQFNGAAATSSGGRPEVNMTHITGATVATGSAQIGANVVSYASGQTPLQPTVAGRTLDVSVGGEAGIDWGNVGSPTSTVGLSGTTISTSQAIGSVSGSIGSVSGNVGGNVVGSVGSVVTAVSVGTNSDKTGYSLTTGERNSIADAFLDRADAVETGVAPRGAFRLMLAALAGKLSGANTTTVAIRNTADTKTRISATVDANGNRTAVTTDIT